MSDKNSGVDKFYGKIGGGGRTEGVSRFSVNSFVSVPKSFVGQPFSASLILGIEKFYA